MVFEMLLLMPSWSFRLGEWGEVALLMSFKLRGGGPALVAFFSIPCTA